MIPHNDAIRRILAGELVADVVHSLIENVTDLHKALGLFKKDLRDFKGLVTRGFSALIQGKEDPRKLNAAKQADARLKDICDYFLKKRVQALLDDKMAGGTRTTAQSSMFDELMNFGNILANAGTNDTVLRKAITVIESGEKLRDALG